MINCFKGLQFCLVRRRHYTPKICMQNIIRSKDISIASVNGQPPHWMALVTKSCRHNCIGIMAPNDETSTSGRRIINVFLTMQFNRVGQWVADH